MKTPQQLVANLLEEVESTSGNIIKITKEDALRIAELLVNVQFVGEVPKKRNGKILFYCPVCEKSFTANGREDRESYAKWHYRTWYAKCPWCKQEISQNDGYWR